MTEKKKRRGAEKTAQEQGLERSEGSFSTDQRVHFHMKRVNIEDRS